MRDAGVEVRGIRLRVDNSRKLAVEGGNEGLFIPDGLEAGGRLMIAEGPTDTAGLLSLGFCVDELNVKREKDRSAFAAKVCDG